MPKPLQISIPRTSLSSDSKPHTIYHITLTLPLRTHTTQKRYSEFTSLHSDLTSQAGAPPPAPLPGKSWLRSTVSSADLTEQRRKGLESYLRAILDSGDARWRSSAAWRSFLSLPANLLNAPGASNATGSDWDSASTSNGRHDRRAGLGGEQVLDANAWLQVHREAKMQVQAARLALRRREDARTAQEQHSSAAEAKAALVRAATGIARCEGSLSLLSASTANAASSPSTTAGDGQKLGDGELRRRKDLLASARKEVEALEAQLRSLAASTRASQQGDGGAGGTTGAAASAGDKAALLGGANGRPSGRVLGGPPAKETERTRELDNTGVLQLQKQILREQDEDVLEIGRAVGRMKEMGLMIGEELEVQNAMLGLVEGDVDRLQGKLDVGKKRIEKIR